MNPFYKLFVKTYDLICKSNCSTLKNLILTLCGVFKRCGNSLFTLNTLSRPTY